MKAIITILAPVNSGEENTSYNVNSREDCRDDTDRSAYDAAMFQGESVSMGCVVVEPVRVRCVLCGQTCSQDPCWQCRNEGR